MRQEEIDAISDGMKRAALTSKKLPEVEVVAWFINEHDGPQFWIGRPRLPGIYHPLYSTPARDGQEPVAALSREYGGIICAYENINAYHPDLKWTDLYLAR